MGKDRLTLFGQTLKWVEALDIIREAERLARWIEQKQVSSGFARNLLIYSWMNNEFNSTRKTEYLRFLPLMTYDIARNLPSLDDRNTKKRDIRIWAEELKDLESSRLKHLGIIVNYALTANRGGKHE